MGFALSLGFLRALAFSQTALYGIGERWSQAGAVVDGEEVGRIAAYRTETS
jgi:hypothetical protein